MRQVAEQITVHCFWTCCCSHVVRAWSPAQAQRLMEAHYEAEHQAHIREVLGRLQP